MAVCCIGIALLAIALYMLGFKSYLPWLVLLACPLMHLLMMKGMRHNHEPRKNEAERN